MYLLDGALLDEQMMTMVNVLSLIRGIVMLRL
jgi:hypothetical protein